MPKDKEQDARLEIRIPKELKNKLVKRVGRDVSEFIRELIIKALK